MLSLILHFWTSNGFNIIENPHTKYELQWRNVYYVFICNSSESFWYCHKVLRPPSNFWGDEGWVSEVYVGVVEKGIVSINWCWPIFNTNKQFLCLFYISKITSAPIGAWKCNFMPFRKLWQTNRPMDRQEGKLLFQYREVDKKK